MAIGRIRRGKISLGEMVSCMRRDGTIKQFRVQKLYSFLGLQRTEVNEAGAGDIIALAGLPDIYVGETVCSVGS